MAKAPSGGPGPSRSPSPGTRGVLRPAAGGKTAGRAFEPSWLRHVWSPEVGSASSAPERIFSVLNREYGGRGRRVEAQLCRTRRRLAMPGRVVVHPTNQVCRRPEERDAVHRGSFFSMAWILGSGNAAVVGPRAAFLPAAPGVRTPPA